jgi:Aspartyl protease
MQVLLEAPITFDVPDGTTHAPMVRARVGGIDTMLILDTGSTDHILTTELTQRLGLELEPGESGTDSAGASVASWTLPAAEVRILDRDFAFRDLVVIDPPGPFPGWGVGGLLSPQHLDPSACAVLDLVDNQLTLVEMSVELGPWLADRHPDLRMLDIEPVAGDGTVLVRAAIDPHLPVVTMFDTGAKATSWAAAAVPGLATGARQTTGRGVGGTESFGSAADDQVLIAGGARIPLPRLLVGEAHGEAHGLVGMDLLRGTVLAVSADPSRDVIWLVPT